MSPADSYSARRRVFAIGAFTIEPDRNLAVAGGKNMRLAVRRHQMFAPLFTRAKAPRRDGQCLVETDRRARRELIARFASATPRPRACLFPLRPPHTAFAKRRCPC